MLKNLLGSIWRWFPRGLRRWTVERLETHFTVTVAAIVVDDNDGILLLDHVFRPGSGWGIPGGFINSREQPEDAIRRELREEIGLDIEPPKLLFVRTNRSVNQIEIVFLCRPVGELKAQSIEINHAAWFKFPDLPSGLSKDQREMIDQA